MSKPYKKWLDEDVVYIITDEERAAFKQLSNDEERDNFIEAFWQRRDPTPDTEENEYKEEHYQRIAYANEHFAAGVPGWKTDRGRIYIVFGKPDEIESHPSGGTYERPMEEGGGETSTFPFEHWRYRYIEGIGQEVIIEFVDTCMCGEYHMTMDRSEKDALLITPNAGLTMWEQMGMANKAARFNGNGLERLGAGPESTMHRRPKNSIGWSSSPNCRQAPRSSSRIWKKLVNSKVILNPMPFDVRVGFREGHLRHRAGARHHPDEEPRHHVRQQRRRAARNREHLRTPVTLTGKIVQTFEDTVQVDVPAELLPRTAENASVYWKALPLRPGPL